MSTPTDDRKGLLTSITSPKKTDSSITKKKYWIIVFAIFLIGIVAIFIFVVYDVFDLKSSSLSNPGMIGLWPTYGGTLKNQQKPPYPSDIKINISNIKNLTIKCLYESPNGTGTMGYPAIDNNENAYFTDLNGYITSINLDSCQIIWRSHIGTLLGYPAIQVLTHQSLTLFQDSNGHAGVLFGAPQIRSNSYPNYLGCYIVAVHINNGKLWWRLNIGYNNNKYDYRCSSHGFYVDGKYAYGGMAQSRSYDATNKSQFIGRYIKIDIDSHKIVNVWYPFNKTLTKWDEYNMSYIGIATYNFPAMMDDYLVFGTGNLYRTPKYIDDCLVYGQGVNISIDGYNQYLELNNSHYIDVCGNDQSNNRFWRCLEQNIYTDSLIILNKTNFNTINAFPLQGCDIYYTRACKLIDNFSPLCPSKGNEGTNSDLTAVAIFKNKLNNKSYIVASQKSTRLYIFELETGKLIISRKFGPGTLTGQFNIAIDEDSMIGITSFSGSQMYGFYPRYKLANNLTVCNGTGTIYAFDLNTGNILWQIINPYGTINESNCFNNSNYEYVDYSVDTSCEYGDFLDESLTASDKVIIPPKSDIYNPISSKSRALFLAPVTIANNMVFIPSITGDIWVHNLFNGAFIHHITCPNVLVNEETNQWNRAGIKGGISIVNDRIVFYCGTYDIGNSVGPIQESQGNIFVSMQLD